MFEMFRRSSRRRAAVPWLTVASPALLCALFFVVGLAVLDDYGMSLDEDWQRVIGASAVDYVLGNDYAPRRYTDWYYGVAFEAPLIGLERILGLEDTRAIYLSRHLVTHLFFIVGGFFCYLLVYRMFNRRLLALLAMLLFLLHPRLYAHSFFNSKDLPLLSMFMIALYLTHRAFRKETVGAFILCGIGVGLLTNFRIVGAMLFPAVLAVRGLDLFYAAGSGGRKRVLATGGVFMLAAVLTLYATWPYLWSNPIGHFGEAFAGMAQFPAVVNNRFRGEMVNATALPPEYIPVWFVITTPPLILLLGIAGIAAVLGRGLARPGAVFGNGDLRFGLLLLACFALPIAAVILLQANLYRDWLHLFFIYAPFCLLAVFGLYRMAAALSRRPVCRGGLYALTGAGIGLIVLQMAQLHPQQQVYFNFLVDRTTPGQLQREYDLDYYRAAHREGLEYILNQHPGEKVYVAGTTLLTDILPAAERERLVAVNPLEREGDYYLVYDWDHRRNANDLSPGVFNDVYTVQAYNNTLLGVRAVNAARLQPSLAAGYQELYWAVTAGEPIIRAGYDVYLAGKTLTWVRAECPAGDLTGQFFVMARPAAVAAGDPDGPAVFVPVATLYGVRFDGKCLAQTRLPDYAVADVVVGQRRGDRVVWNELHNLARPGLRDLAAALRKERGQASFPGAFEALLSGKRLIYAKSDCTRADWETRFFLHLFPADAMALPPERRGIGFDNRDFEFTSYGGWSDGECLAIVPLPDYPIVEIRTGQYVPGQGELWSVELTVER